MRLVTGATGVVGGRVARILAKNGKSSVRLVRDPLKAPRLSRTKVVVGDHADPASLLAAFAGVDVAFIVSGHAKPGERWLFHASAATSARIAGVSRIVNRLFQGAASDSAFSFARDQYQIEKHIRYLDEVPTFFGDDGIVRGPAGNCRAA